MTVRVCPSCPEYQEDCPCLKAVLPVVGPEPPVVTNAAGRKQSPSPYRCDRLPSQGVLAVAAVLASGAARHGEGNWRKIPVADHLNHALVHLLAWQAGDRSDDHVAHAAMRLLFALELQLRLPAAAPSRS
jgi:hypothetical protein